ncbi:MAG: hypothetical protein HYY02_12790 [Chloroflexi bacterium]|nr:hypothetical protein [Chloroflexota bacterium]
MRLAGCGRAPVAGRDARLRHCRGRSASSCYSGLGYACPDRHGDHLIHGHAGAHRYCYCYHGRSGAHHGSAVAPAHICGRAHDHAGAADARSPANPTSPFGTSTHYGW